jgi:hypothetical protein
MYRAECERWWRCLMFKVTIGNWKIMTFSKNIFGPGVLAYTYYHSYSRVTVIKRLVVQNGPRQKVSESETQFQQTRCFKSIIPRGIGMRIMVQGHLWPKKKKKQNKKHRTLFKK